MQVHPSSPSVQVNVPYSSAGCAPSLTVLDPGRPVTTGGCNQKRPPFIMKFVCVSSQKSRNIGYLLAMNRRENEDYSSGTSLRCIPYISPLATGTWAAGVTENTPDSRIT